LWSTVGLFLFSNRLCGALVVPSTPQKRERSTAIFSIHAPCLRATWYFVWNKFYVNLWSTYALTKIVRKSWDLKDRQFSPIFSKWEYFCQNWRICLFLPIFSWFLSVRVHDMSMYSSVAVLPFHKLGIFMENLII